MKIELIPSLAVPVGEDQILDWIKRMEKNGSSSIESGDTLVREGIVPGKYDVYRLTQTYEVIED